jgi:putative ABC transport system permease protein
MAIAVTAVVALVGLSDAFNRAMLQQYVQRGVSLIVTRSDSIQVINTNMPEKVAHDIEKMNGVDATCPGLLSLSSIDELGDGLAIQGWPEGNHMFHEIKLTSGVLPAATDKGPKPVIVGQQLARLKSVKVGDTLTISDEKYKVSGVFESVADLENGMVIMLLNDAQKAFGQSGKITGCTVKLKDNSPENVSAICKKIESTVAEQNGLAGKIRAKPPDQFVQNNGQIRMFKGFAWAVSFIALIIGGIGVLNTMFMSVFERTREIGILRAIGWRPQRVMRMILLESVALSAGAGVVGTAAGFGIIFGLCALPTLNGAAQGAITWQIAVTGFMVAIVVGVLGAAYPAFRGSRLLPTEALRHE